MELEPNEVIQEPELTEQQLRQIHLIAAVASGALLVLSFIATASI
ncbi:hypothetical protein GCM10011297_25590 [Bacterioplanes sanyensis]|nr:hypothetical protein [Bacterioplanes sanyensis]GGY51726.1 hypothetical protein GCM10011297_25590 [Bacterioplanes sanyensis]